VLTPDQWQAIRDLGIGGLMTVALLGGYRGWYVWRSTFKAMEADRDLWRGIALKALGHADKAIDVASRKSDGA
jgi:hypothetical protein